MLEEVLEKEKTREYEETEWKGFKGKITFLTSKMAYRKYWGEGMHEQAVLNFLKEAGFLGTEKQLTAMMYVLLIFSVSNFSW